MTVFSLAMLPAYRATLATSLAQHRRRHRGRNAADGIPLRLDRTVRGGVEIACTTRCGFCATVLAHARRGLAEVAA